MKFLLGILICWSATIIYVYLLGGMQFAIGYAVITGLLGIGIKLMADSI